MKDWMPENPHRCNCRGASNYDGDIEDARNHSFDEGCQQTARRIINEIDKRGQWERGWSGNRLSFRIDPQYWEKLREEVIDG